MGELYEPFPKLPKNIRQIGERDQVLKLYLEDYVNTYLKRLQPPKGADLRVGLLLGSRETHEDTPYVFVDGALEMDCVTQEGEKVVFTEDAWKKAYQEVEQLFPKRTVQGWFLCGSPGCSLSPLNYWRQHSQYFTGKNQLMYLNCGLEGEEAIYITSSDGFYKLRGYSVYYERNQMMQDYMILRKDVPRAEAEVDDKVIRDFKQRMDERKYEVGRHRSTVGVLSGLCSALAITVLAGGVAMFNNYQKMHQMESVIASVMPEGSVGKELLASSDKSGTAALAENPSGKGWSALDEPDYVIEEAAGKVYPTTAPAEENGKEQSGQVTPETMPAAESSTRDDSGGQGAGETTAGDKASGQAASGDKTSGQAAIGDKASGQAASGDEVSGQVASGSKASGQTATADKASSAGQTAAADTAGAVEKAAAASEPPSEQPTPPPTGARESAASETVSAVNYSIYTVEDGETLYGICFKLYHNLNHLDEICRVNALTDENSIIAGQKLLVP